jgi:hypothetical protein
MELAVAQGFDVRVVALPPGVDPADEPSGFEDRLRGAEPYALYRTRIEIDRAPDPQAAYEAVRALLDRLPESPQRQDAWKLANDRLGMTVRINRTVAAHVAAGRMSPRLLESADRQERYVLAGCIAHPELVRMLAEASPAHFDSELNRRLADVLCGRAEPDGETTALRAELDAVAGRDGIDANTAKEALLRLHERHLRRELQNADFERVPELQAQLARIQQAVGGLA